jgi:putative transposase
LKGGPVKRSKFTDEQILAIVKKGEAGRKVADLCRHYGITEQTYYRWKAKYGSMELS